MAKARHDWEQIIQLTREFIGQTDSWVDLGSVINARIQTVLPRRTLEEGIRRELDIEGSFAEVREALGGRIKVLTPLAAALLAYLRGKGRDTAHSLVNLCERFDRSPSSIQTAVDELLAEDYFIEVSDDRHLIMPITIPASREIIPVEHWIEAEHHRFGVVADSHLANRNARLDVLQSLYDVFELEGIKIVLHLGNLVDGEFKWNRSELLAHGVEGQLVYAFENYPKREGIETHFITANCHEGWWARDIGLDIGRHMHNAFHDLGRDDLQWLGHVETDLSLFPGNERAILRLFHPGGGSAYAISYPLQKHVEAWQGGEKPQVALFGHYHKYGAFYPREVYSFMPGTTCDQTLFMRMHKLPAQVGGCLLEIKMTPAGGLGRVTHSFFPFYDKGYYKTWDYRSYFEKK